MSFEEWKEKYKPIQNKFQEDSPHNNCMFEVDGEEGEFVKTTNPKTVWTQIEEEGKFYIFAGWRRCDRMGYFATEVEWENDDIEVSIEEEPTAIESLQTVINYLYDDEKKSYEANKDNEEHVFIHIKNLIKEFNLKME